MPLFILYNLAMKKIGKLTTHPFAFLEKHEAQTIAFLMNIGKDIEILAPIRSKGVRTPDIAMDGVCWEIKCPVGNSKRTIVKKLKNASKQSANIIFDLRKTKLSEQKCLLQLETEYKLRTAIKRLLVITKNNTLLDIKK